MHNGTVSYATLKQGPEVHLIFGEEKDARATIEVHTTCFLRSLNLGA